MRPSELSKPNDMQLSPPLTIGFAGSPEFATSALAALVQSRHQVKVVYTQPDRQAGRGQKIATSAVKQLALAEEISVLQPHSLKAPAAVDEFQALQLDLLVVVAYGQILPPSVLNVPQLGCWNIHASLLPRWRGAAPIQRAIQAGDKQSGVCIMQMDQGLDTGPILRQCAIDLDTDETGGSLHDRLATLGSQALMETLSVYDHGELSPAVAQAEAGATYANKLTKAEAQIDWQQSAVDIERSIRAFNPWPVCWAQLQQHRIRIFAAQALTTTAEQAPGEILSIDETGIRVACGQGQLIITHLQKPGGKQISARDYYNSLSGRV